MITAFGRSAEQLECGEAQQPAELSFRPRVQLSLRARTFFACPERLRGNDRRSAEKPKTPHEALKRQTSWIICSGAPMANLHW
jgi:hypothetical protein